MACWHYVKGADNPADCASREIFSAELMEHDFWRKRPQWLKETEEKWNVKVSFDKHPVPSEERDVQQTLLPVITSDLLPLEKISEYNHLAWITAWIPWFVNNATCRKRGTRNSCSVLSPFKIKSAKELWW